MAFLTAKEAKLYGLVVAGVTLLALIGTLVFLLLSREPEPVSQSRTGRAESSAELNCLEKSARRRGLFRKSGFLQSILSCTVRSGTLFAKCTAVGIKSR